MKPGASESLQDRQESSWAITFNGLVQEPICVLASDWAQIPRHCIFLCPISDQLISPFLSWRLTQSITLLNLLPRCHALVRTEINFLSRSFSSIGLPSKKVLVKWDPQSREIENFGKGTQGKRKQQVRKSDWGIGFYALGFTCDPQHVFAFA